MLTLFTTPKPFRGHIGVIQRNALKSWTLLHPEVEVILFGEEEGSAEVARGLGIRHEPHVQRNEFGTNLLDDMFSKAHRMARYDILCYANCDIILMSDFLRALERVRARHRRFLMVGRRWDTPITERIDFNDAGWAEKTRRMALSANARRGEWWIDYFAFPRSVFIDGLPPFAVGRPRWDNWTVWRVLQAGVPVVDASPVVLAVHQNHDYNHHPQGEQGVWEGEEAKRNLELAGGWDHLRNILDASLILRPKGLRINAGHYWRALIKPWRIASEREQFLVVSPGRIRHFLHLCRCNLAHPHELTRGELAYNWLHAFFELLVGRKHSHYLEGVRTRIKKASHYFARRAGTAVERN